MEYYSILLYYFTIYRVKCRKYARAVKSMGVEVTSEFQSWHRAAMEHEQILPLSLSFLISRTDITIASI